MLLEDQRFIHEDLERLEQGISDRILDEPRTARERLNRDHQIASFLNRIHDQSQRLLDIYKDADGTREKEIQSITTGDPLKEFYTRFTEIKDFHRRYPNEPVENLEKAYRLRDGEGSSSFVENMFTGEEAYGRFFDLTQLHEEYLNLPGVKRLTYLTYLDIFDKFLQPDLPLKRSSKLTDKYFQYVGNLAKYLEDFIARIRPLEPLESLFAKYDEDFNKLWDANQVPGWEPESAKPKTEGTGEGIWCPDCEKEFKNENVYKAHLKGKKHIKNAQARMAKGSTAEENNGLANRLKERAVAEREHRVRSLAETLSQERQATRVNVERKQGMTERERQMELEALFADESAAAIGSRPDDESDEEGDDKLYNPLKLPLAWDGKPIPYWLYKLHGLGVEFTCEICGNYVYMGRRAFDKHFSEARHIYGLRCLGITSQTGLFREITKIDEALRLWEKLEKDRKREKENRENVVQMEDAEGNVMPERIYQEFPRLLRVIVNSPIGRSWYGWSTPHLARILGTCGRVSLMMVREFANVRGFEFSHICDLFDELEHSRLLKTTTTGRAKDLESTTIRKWFNQHRTKIFAPATDKYALLSCLLPVRRPDRVLGLGLASLSRIIGRCLLLGSTRFQQLSRYKERGNGDFGHCLEGVLCQTEEGRESSGVTVEELNDALDQIGSSNRFSSSELRSETRSAVDIDRTLGAILRKVNGREGKWFIRIILKDPITDLVPDLVVLQHFHFLFPHILAVRGSLQKAVQMLEIDPFNTFPSCPEAQSRKALCRLAVPYLTPVVGCKVGRPDFLKARSIEHCLSMVGRKTATVERKYDGEYFQVHVGTLGSGQDSITIFSKSGKDSTSDRIGIHDLVKRSLRLDCDGHHISNCILEGELLVWSDQEKDILPFHHIRKHVTRRGLHLGAENDSQPGPGEHLYIVFFDILLLNNQNCLALPFRERRDLLSSSVHCIPGISALAEHCDIDFSRNDASDELRNCFARAIAHRWEGLVLKRLDDFYHCSSQHNGQQRVGSWIKLKKDYITGLGDTADFAIVGAAYDAMSVPPRNKIVPNLRWTTFLVGCLECIQNDSRPVFRIVSSLDHHNLPADVLRTLNTQGQFIACNADRNELPFLLRYDQHCIKKADVIFRHAFVVEMYGAGFEKPHSVKYWTLRFPRVTKIHKDRDWRDALSFSELQKLAQDVMSMPSNMENDVGNWTKRLGGIKTTDSPDQADSATGCSDESSQEMVSLFNHRTSLALRAETVLNPYTMADSTLELEHLSEPSPRDHSDVPAGDSQDAKLTEGGSELVESEDTVQPSEVSKVSVHVDHPDRTSHIPPFFSARPVFFGTSLSARHSELQKYFQGLKNCTSSLPKFLDAVIFSEKHQPTLPEFSSITPADYCRGIVLVDLDKKLAGRAALDISHMGNALAARKRAGEFNRSGFILVMNWRIVELFPQLAPVPENSTGDGVEPVTTPNCAESTKRFYAGCLRWSVGVPRGFGGSRKRKSCHDAGDDKTLVTNSFTTSSVDRSPATSDSDVLYDTRDWEETVSHCISS
ncbi:hypothetical protein KEM54_003005 [Ascosphaera aggregata]|nr:hypothetical protein KEM54_003005 [Ascosphaera aggregata]